MMLQRQDYILNNSVQMTKKIVFNIVALAMVFASCSSTRTKEHHKFTVNLCKYEINKCACNLYAEVYQVFGMGAMGSDLDSQYLTDSINFRVFLGTFDEEDEMIITRCKGDSIQIEKARRVSHGVSMNKARIIIMSKTYSLTDLKSRHVFE